MFTGIISEVGTVGAVLSTAAFAQPAADPPSIAVNGEGIVKVAPDQAWVRVGTESRSKVSK